MKKWYRVLNPFSDYQRGAIICPEGLNRESLQVRGWITRHPVFIGPRKPTADEVEAWGKPVPMIVAEVEPEVVDDISDDEPDLLTATVEDAIQPTGELATLPRRRGRHGR